ncbi:site-specific integrase [Thiomicrorhabdus indica]|uniref:tyrosine-type recombinase/integrase n=1 Tax=Thiomicrorhabdus indica TaxID=2267253 RepID=UPI002AA8FC3C|nr:site-specific integrase [Thiomicrorhabdus indica]
MSINKRGNTWWVDLTAPNGKRVRRSAKTQVRKEAQEFHDKLKAELWRVHQIGDKPKYTWQEAVIRFLQETQDKKSREDDIRQFQALNRWLKNVNLYEINRDLVDKITQERFSDGVKPATVRRMLATLSTVLNRAYKEWEWLDKVPHIKKPSSGDAPVRWITKPEAHRLLKILPDHLSAMAAFTLATGLREQNVVRLKWSNVDITRKTAWVDANDIKNKRALAVPLNEDAIAILKEQMGEHNVFVFTYKGNPVTGANTRAWRAGLKKAGIENFRWHDLRHTWASWHVQNGTPLAVLKELGGWKTMDMVLRYAHLSSSHLTEFTSAVSLGVSTHGTNTSQSINTGLKFRQ